MTRPGGSYDPTCTVTGGLPPEIARLEAQAALTWPDERRALADAGALQGRPLLDLGCGSGAVLARLREEAGDRLVLGLDADTRLLAHARSAGPVCAGRLEALPLRSGVLGAAVVRYVLQHLADPVPALREVHRALRPGGTVAVVDVDAQLWGACEPSFPEVGSVNQKMARAQAGAGGDRAVGRRLTRLLTAAGFVDVALHPVAVTSDGRGVEAFGLHVGPDRLAPLVEQGALTISDLGLAAAAWERFRRDPDAWIMLLVFVATARRA